MGGTWAEGDRLSQYINYKLTAFPTELYNVEDFRGLLFNSQKEMKVPLILDVGEIGQNVFNNSGITSVTFLSPIAIIGENAFRDCKNLTTVKFALHGSSVSGADTIQSGAFYGCENLTSVIFPETWYDGELTINNNAFYGCKNLTSLTIPTAQRVGFGDKSLYIGSEENKATITFNDLYGNMDFYSEDVINPKTTDKIITFSEATAEAIKTQLPSVANLVEVVSK